MPARESSIRGRVRPSLDRSPSDTGLRRARERPFTWDAEMGAEELGIEPVADECTDKTSHALSELSAVRVAANSLFYEL
jgi:hypothetical protein